MRQTHKITQYSTSKTLPGSINIVLTQINNIPTMLEWNIQTKINLACTQR